MTKRVKRLPENILRLSPGNGDYLPPEYLVEMKRCLFLDLVREDYPQVLRDLWDGTRPVITVILPNERPLAPAVDALLARLTEHPAVIAWSCAHALDTAWVRTAAARTLLAWHAGLPEMTWVWRQRVSYPWPGPAFEHPVWNPVEEFERALRERFEAYVRTTKQQAEHLGLIAPKRQKLEQHARWLAQASVGRQSFTRIARTHDVTREAVKVAVLEYARTIDLTFPSSQ